MEYEAAMVTLGKAAIGQPVGRHLGSDRLIQLGLDAVP
jgi:hypothetical protein